MANAVVEYSADNTIRAQPAGSSYAFGADTGLVQAFFSQKATDANAVKFTSFGYNFAWQPDAVSFIDDTGALDVIYGVASARVQTGNTRAVYVGTTPLTTDEWIVGLSDVKHNIRVEIAPRLPADYIGNPVQFAAGGWISFDSSLQLFADGVQQTTDFTTNGAITFIDPNGREIFRLPDVFAKDSDGNVSFGGYKVVFNDDGSISFWMLIDWSWMQQAVYPVVIDPTVVTASPYALYGYGGSRKEVHLSNGWLLAIAESTSSPNTTYVYVSKDSGQTWVQLCYISSTQQGGSIASNGTSATIAFGVSGIYNNTYSVTFDATTVTNTDLSSSKKVAIAGYGPKWNTPLAIDGNGVLWAAATSGSTIYYSKSSDGGQTWSATGTAANSSVRTFNYLSMVITSNNYPVIFADWSNNSNPTGYGIDAVVFNGSSWADNTVYSVSSYSQSCPTAVIDANDNTMYVLWHGTDSTDSGVANIRFSKSTDGGNTWSAMAKLTSGNTYNQQYPTATIDPSNNNLYVFFIGRGSGSYDQLRYIKFTQSAGSWSAVTDLTSNTTASVTYAAALFSKFNMNSSDAVRYLYTDSQASAVKSDSISLNTAPLAPTLTQESNFDATIAQTLKWTFNDTPGDTQSAYQLEIYDVTNTTTPVLSVPKTGSTSSTYALAANTLTNGKSYQWHVMTYDSQGLASPWSGYSTFKCSATPQANVTAPAANSTVSGDTYTFLGSYSQAAGSPQQSYEFKLYDAAGNPISGMDSGTITGTTNAKTFSGLANNTSYMVEFIATSQDGISASSGKIPFSVAYTPPGTPTASVTNDAANARTVVSFTNQTPTTNLVKNSDFETFTNTATVFSDGLTSSAAWSGATSNFTFGANGATSNASGSILQAGNSAWKPLTGSGGQNLALTFQATFTTQATLTSVGSLTTLEMWQNSNNRYFFRINSATNTLYLYKYINGVSTVLASAAFTPAANTTYTMTLSKDTSGNFTAKLYSGTGTGGTLLQTLPASNDNSLAGGFLLAVGGDTGVVISGVQVMAPWANNWTISGSTSFAWALTQSAISGNYSPSCVGISGGDGYIYQTMTSLTITQAYTLSANVQTTNVGTNGARVYLNGTPAINATAGVTGTTASTRFAGSGKPQTTSQSIIIGMWDSGYAVFDAIQFETGSTATVYVRNDSTTSTATNFPAAASNNVFRRKVGTSAWTSVATGVTSPYNDYLCPAGQFEYGVTAVSSAGASSDYGKAQVTSSFQGDWLIDSTSGAQFQFIYNRQPYAMDTQESRKTFETYSSKRMISRGPLNSKHGQLAALMVNGGLTPIQQIQAFESSFANHPPYWLKTPLGDVLKVDVFNLKRNVPEEFKSPYAIEIAVEWEEMN